MWSRLQVMQNLTQSLVSLQSFYVSLLDSAFKLELSFHGLRKKRLQSWICDEATSCQITRKQHILSDEGSGDMTPSRFVIEPDQDYTCGVLYTESDTSSLNKCHWHLLREPICAPLLKIPQ